MARLRELFSRPSITDYVIALFTVVLAVTSYYQWKEIHAGSADTHTLAGAAKEQADAEKDAELLARESKEATDGAYLAGGVYQYTGDFVHLEIENSGKSPATGIHGEFMIQKQTDGGKIIGAPITFSADRGKMLPASEGGSSLDKEIPVPGLSEMTDRIENWQQVVVVRGWIRYDDGFGKVITEPICTETVPVFQQGFGCPATAFSFVACGGRSGDRANWLRAKEQPTGPRCQK